MVTSRFAINYICSKYEGCQENVYDQKKKLYDDMETVTDLSYLGDRINTGGCETAVASKTRLRWVK